MVQGLKKSPTYIRNLNINCYIQFFFRSNLRESFVAFQFFGILKKVDTIALTLACKSKKVISEISKPSFYSYRVRCLRGLFLLEPRFNKLIVIKPSDYIGKNTITLSCR